MHRHGGIGLASHPYHRLEHRDFLFFLFFLNGIIVPCFSNGRIRLPRNETALRFARGHEKSSVSKHTRTHKHRVPRRQNATISAKSCSILLLHFYTAICIVKVACLSTIKLESAQIFAPCIHVFFFASRDCFIFSKR